MRRPLIFVGIVISALLVVGVAIRGYLRRAVRQPQEFYVAALRTEPEALEQESRSLESRVAALYNDAQTEPQWQAAFSEAEINGWLAAELPRQFPELLPPELSQPRVAIRDDRLLVGVQYRDQNIESPISIEVDLFATDSDLLAIRFCDAKAGAVPLPIANVVDSVARVARQLDWAVRWTRYEGDPVALAPLRGLVSNDAMRRELHAVELVDGEIILAGQTIPHMASRAPNQSDETNIR